MCMSLFVSCKLDMKETSFDFHFSRRPETWSEGGDARTRSEAHVRCGIKKWMRHDHDHDRHDFFLLVLVLIQSILLWINECLSGTKSIYFAIVTGDVIA